MVWHLCSDVIALREVIIRKVVVVPLLCNCSFFSRIETFHLAGISLNRKVNNSKLLQEVPKNDQIHWALLFLSK